MYLTPELRFGLFSVDPKELGAYSLEEYLQEKSEAVTLGIVEPVAIGAAERVWYRG
jgi:hypothetical protein